MTSSAGSGRRPAWPTAPASSSPRLRARGPLATLPTSDLRALLERGRSLDPRVAGVVSDLIAEVRDGGEAALRAQSRRFDGVEPVELEIPREAWRRELDRLDPRVRAALERSASNIVAFHRAQLPPPLEVELAPGLRLGRRADPLKRVGAYVPGGRAAYPSTVLMCVLPAKVAGVDEVVVCSPPGPDGRPAGVVLAACELVGADRVFALGGAGAVAALALGVGGVPAVDKIVGPGNAYVAEAKRQLTGRVAIDSPAGPSEVLVIADDGADPELVAAELMAQAEHDPDAAAVLVSVDPTLPAKVAGVLADRLPHEPRRSIIEAALAESGALLTASTLEEAVRFGEAYAPEHLLLLVREPRSVLPRVRAAGTVFLGAPSSVAFGDYMSGANHTLPTGTLARAYSGLSTLDFIRWTTYQELSPPAAAELSRPTAALAEAEGLLAHARAALLRSGALPEEPPASDTAWMSGAAVHSAAGATPRRAAYASVELYDPGRRPMAIDLSDNTNRFGPSPAAARVLAQADEERVTRYPSVYAGELKEALASWLGVSPDSIATGCGSDDLIDSAMRAFAEPGDAVAYPEPTFGMVPAFGRMNALSPLAVPSAPDLTPPLEALLATRARVTYLCRPNNPTGTLPERDVVAGLEAGSSGIVLLDEAYADFAADDMVGWAAHSERCVVLRTFSKAFGLAGLRVGFAVGPPPLIREIEKSRGPYKVGGLAEAAATAAVREDIGWLRDTVAKTRESRSRLSGELRARGLQPLPSAANFLLVPLPPAAGGAAALASRLRERGVQVRPFPALSGIGEAVRVTVGPWDVMRGFLAALDGALENS